jgi:hypothetical protein
MRKKKIVSSISVGVLADRSVPVEISQFYSAQMDTGI